jgi:hypothetical protein
VPLHPELEAYLEATEEQMEVRIPHVIAWYNLLIILWRKMRGSSTSIGNLAAW